MRSIAAAIDIALDRPRGEVIGVLLLWATPIILGVALFALARWARRRNDELKLGVAPEADLIAAIARRDLRQVGRLLFLSDIPHSWEQAGRILALVVVVAVLSLFGVILILVLRAISQA
jgi:hypothetical protein